MSEKVSDELCVLKAQLIDSFFRLKHLVTKLHVEADSKHGKIGISIAELELMKEIRDNTLDSECNACIADIQNRLYISKAGVSKMLGVLEEKGCINRDVDKNNRRNLIITLTQEGKNVLCELDKGNGEMLIKIIRQLGESETKQFVEYVDKFTDAMSEL